MSDLRPTSPSAEHLASDNEASDDNMDGSDPSGTQSETFSRNHNVKQKSTVVVAFSMDWHIGVVRNVREDGNFEVDCMNHSKNHKKQVLNSEC